jgi:hypothetical protein
MMSAISWQEQATFHLIKCTLLSPW